MPRPPRPSLLVFDLDGTLYRGSEAVPGAAESLAQLRSQGYGIRFLTNNSGLSRRDLVRKLTSLGFEAAAEEVFGTALGAARRLQEMACQRPFVIGEPGLHATLAEHGLSSVESDADVVLVGICRSFTYELLRRGMREIRGGARFVATNTDASYPIEGGDEIPGAGSLVAAMRTCSGVDPLVIGKPEPYLLQLVAEDTGVDMKSILVVGDRVETDLECARRAGAYGVLVRTGVSQDGWPDALASVADLPSWLSA